MIQLFPCKGREDVVSIMLTELTGRHEVADRLIQVIPHLRCQFGHLVRLITRVHYDDHSRPRDEMLSDLLHPLYQVDGRTY